MAGKCHPGAASNKTSSSVKPAGGGHKPAVKRAQPSSSSKQFDVGFKGGPKKNLPKKGSY